MSNYSVDESSAIARVSLAAYHDFLAGSVAGAASVISGQPFDTIKVRNTYLTILLLLHCKLYCIGKAPGMQS